MHTRSTSFSIVLVALGLLSGCGDDTTTDVGAATLADAASDGRLGDDVGENDGGGNDGASVDGSAGSEDGSIPCVPSEPAPDGHCQAVAGGRCYYVDAQDGSDDNDGTFDSPFQTLANLNRSIYGAYRTPGWVELQAGDVVYLRGGTHSTVYHPGHDGGPNEGGSFIIYFDRLETGSVEAPITIQGYPGERAIIDSGYAALPISIQASRHLRVAGLEIRNGWSRGVLLSGVEDVVVERVVVRDTDGPTSNNIAGIEVHSSSAVEVRHSAFIDNYDRTAAMEDRQTHNSCNAVAFGGRGAFRVHHNAFIQSRPAPFSGCGFKYKHAAQDSTVTFELDHNYFENHMYAAVGIGTANAHVHHNVISGAPVAFSSVDWGGPTHQQNQVYEFNTIYRARAFYASPTLDWVDDEGGPWNGFMDVIFRDNVVHDETPDPSLDRRTVMFNAYLSDALHDVAAAGAGFARNCYWSDNGVGFGIAEQNSTHPAGGFFDLATWQTAYGWDVDSVIEDPMFADPSRGDFTPIPAGKCASRGAFADGHTPPTSAEDVLACH